MHQLNYQTGELDSGILGSSKLDLTLNPRKGVADEILSRRGHENNRAGSRPRSASSTSSASVSTVSTNKSRSPSPPPRSHRVDSPKPRRKVSRSPARSTTPEDRRRKGQRRDRDSRSASPDRRLVRDSERARSSRGEAPRRGNGSSGRPPTQRESLSPYSRRLGLTAALGRS